MSMLAQAFAISFFRAIRPLKIMTTYATNPRIANKNPSKMMVFIFSFSLQPAEVRGHDVCRQQGERGPSPDHQCGFPAERADYVALAMPGNQECRIVGAFHQYGLGMQIKLFGCGCCGCCCAFTGR